MSWRKKANLDSSYIIKRFANWFSQMCTMVLPKFFYVIAGRGAAKTTDLQAERFLEMAYDMPGAPVVWVSDTYSNLQKNVLPTFLEALENKGYKEGTHYVIGKIPPVFSADQKAELDANVRESFWQPYNKLATYKHTLIFFTGFNVTFGSLDRPASLAGRSYVHCFGDEVKYFKESKIANLLKAVRGYKAKFGKSVFYLGHTFTTDMPDVSRIGEHDWILRQGSRMQRKGIITILQAAFVVNEALGELLAAKDAGITAEIIKKQRVYERWVERWTAIRKSEMGSTLFYIASSFVNVDILGVEWFKTAQATDLGDLNTAILSMMAGLEDGDRFYANIADKHFYQDGNDPYWSEQFGINDEPDCRILKYLNREKALIGGMDFGNMNSLLIAQEEKAANTVRCLKFHYTLSPQWLDDLAKELIVYYKPQRNKTIRLYYDRAANNYKQAKQDLATQFKKAVEWQPNEAGELERTGWKVILMSEGQGNIGKNEEYIFMQSLLSGTNRKLPKVLIDQFNCKPLKCSLELTKTAKNTRGQIEKDKRTEKLPIKRLPLESSNPSDSFKYLLMTRTNRKLYKASRSQDAGSLSTSD